LKKPGKGFFGKTGIATTDDCVRSSGEVKCSARCAARMSLFARRFEWKG